ncbi:MAG: hypothetical protein ABI978_00900 [Chloroflexota bacterium]
MTPWMVLTAFVAAINLFAFIAFRGRWDRLLMLALSALLGTIAGNAIGSRTGLELVRIGDFHLVAASLAAQLAMLVTDLLGHLRSPAPPPERTRGEGRDGERADR